MSTSYGCNYLIFNQSKKRRKIIFVIIQQFHISRNWYYVLYVYDFILQWLLRKHNQKLAKKYETMSFMTSYLLKKKFYDKLTYIYRGVSPLLWFWGYDCIYNFFFFFFSFVDNAMQKINIINIKSSYFSNLVV